MSIPASTPIMSGPASTKMAIPTKPSNGTVIKPTGLPVFVSGASGVNVVVGSAFAVVLGGVLALVL
jgi:hypothetical protein